MKVVRQVKRLGTVGILRLTKEMSKEDANELVTYISRLEASEDNLAQQIQRFYDSVSHGTYH